MQAMDERARAAGLLLLAVVAQGCSPKDASEFQSPPMTQSAIEKSMVGAFKPCQLQKDMFEKDPLTTVHICEQAIGDIERVKSEAGSISGHDRNVYYLLLATADLMFEGAYMVIDRDTVRYCQKVETAWASIAKIVDTDSPPGNRPSFEKVRKNQIPAVRECRLKYGAPADAVALPG